MAPPFTKVTSTNIDNPEHALLYNTPTYSGSTPQCIKLSGYMRQYSGPRFIRAIPLYKSLDRELRGMFVGPMPVLEFIKLLLPCGAKRLCADIIIKVTNTDFKLKNRVSGEVAEDKIVSRTSALSTYSLTLTEPVCSAQRLEGFQEVVFPQHVRQSTHDTRLLLR